LTPSNSLLSLYSGPLVTIRIGPSGREYKLSKALLCEQSPYFKATFEGEFQEGHDQATTLEEVDGVVSIRSFELLVQWLYIGQLRFGKLTPSDSITAAIEFVRIADMCGVTGMEISMAKHIKAVILANLGSYLIKPYSNTYCMNSDHVVSAACLPDGHPVRKILAAAAVREYLKKDDHMFSKEAREVLNFASDLLEAVKFAIKTSMVQSNSVLVKDPLRGDQMYLS
jgi:hypothetical protein